MKSKRRNQNFNPSPEQRSSNPHRRSTQRNVNVDKEGVHPLFKLALVAGAIGGSYWLWDKWKKNHPSNPAGSTTADAKTFLKSLNPFASSDQPSLPTATDSTTDNTIVVPTTETLPEKDVLFIINNPILHMCFCANELQKSNVSQSQVPQWFRNENSVLGIQ